MPHRAASAPNRMVDELIGRETGKVSGDPLPWRITRQRASRKDFPPSTTKHPRRQWLVITKSTRLNKNLGQTCAQVKIGPNQRSNRRNQFISGLKSSRGEKSQRRLTIDRMSRCPPSSEGANSASKVAGRRPNQYRFRFTFEEERLIILGRTLNLIFFFR